jgi:hypothetical protein
MVGSFILTFSHEAYMMKLLEQLLFWRKKKNPSIRFSVLDDPDKGRRGLSDSSDDFMPRQNQVNQRPPKASTGIKSWTGSSTKE